MQTKQSEEPRALSLQEMEEVNGGGLACAISIGSAFAGMVGAAWTGVGLVLGAIAVVGVVASSTCAGYLSVIL